MLVPEERKKGLRIADIRECEDIRIYSRVFFSDVSFIGGFIVIL